MYKHIYQHIKQCSYATTTQCLSLQKALRSSSACTYNHLQAPLRFQPIKCCPRSLLHTASSNRSNSKTASSENSKIDEIVSSVIRDATPSSSSSQSTSPSASSAEIPDRFVRRPRSSQFGRHFLKPRQPMKVSTFQQIFDKLEQVRFGVSKLRSDNPAWTEAQLHESKKYIKLVEEADELLERLFEPIAANPTKASVRLWSRDFRDIFFMIKELQLFNHTWRFFQLFQLHQQLQWRWRAVKYDREKKAMRRNGPSSSGEKTELKVPPVSDRLIGLMLYCLAHSPQQGPGVARAELEWMYSPKRAKWFQLQESHFRVVLQAYIEAANRSLGLPQKILFKVNEDKTQISLRSAKMPPATSDQLAKFVANPVFTFYKSIPRQFASELQAFTYAAFLASLHHLDESKQVLAEFHEAAKKPPETQQKHTTSSKSDEISSHDEPLDDSPFAQALASNKMTAEEEAEEEAAEKQHQAQSAQRKGKSKK